MVRYIDAKTAQDIDEELTGKYAFSIDQLMELAGLSVATAVYDYILHCEAMAGKESKVLVICGINDALPFADNFFLI